MKQKIIQKRRKLEQIWSILSKNCFLVFLFVCLIGSLSKNDYVEDTMDVWRCKFKKGVMVVLVMGMGGRFKSDSTTIDSAI